MDPNGHIYVAPEDQIPAEDKSRLEGYLRGRAEKYERMELEAKLRELADLEDNKRAS